MAYKKKKFLTKEDKLNLIDKYKEQIDAHLLTVVDGVVDYFVEDSKKEIPIWEDEIFENNYRNPETGTVYNFENSILLGLANKNYENEDTRFITAKQGFDNGLSMEKGTKGTYIIQRFGMPMFPMQKRDESNKPMLDDKGKPIFERDENNKVKYMYQRVEKLVKVFNIQQFTGEIPEKWNKVNEKVILENEEELQEFKKELEKTSFCPITRINQDKNFYSPSRDIIQLTESNLFNNTLSEISVMAHEMSHSTGHKDRLDRGSLYRYAETVVFRGFEELVANLSARTLTDKYGLSDNNYSETYNNNHDSYDASWMSSVLRAEPLLVFEAAKQAELACRFIIKPLEVNLKNNPLLNAIYFGEDNKDTLNILFQKQKQQDKKDKKDKKVKKGLKI